MRDCLPQIGNQNGFLPAGGEKEMKKYFHLTPFYRGRKVVLHPMVPENPDFFGDNIPRVCFAPSIVQCIKALHPGRFVITGRLYTYLCLEPEKLIESFASDRQKTGEKIAREPIMAMYVGKIVIPSDSSNFYKDKRILLQAKRIEGRVRKNVGVL